MTGSTRRGATPFAPNSLFDLSATADWDDAVPSRPVADFHDLDVGELVAVGGILHDGKLGILIMRRTARGWVQKGRFTTAHLNRQYVCSERLDVILEKWMPVDFRTADAMRIRARQLSDVWEPFEDGAPTTTHLEALSARFGDDGA